VDVYEDLQMLSNFTIKTQSCVTGLEDVSDVASRLIVDCIVRGIGGSGVLVIGTAVDADVR